MPKQMKITYIIEILCTIKAVCLPYMISKFSKAFAGYVVSKGGLISEGIFNLVPTSKECVKSLSKGQLISKCLFGVVKFFQKRTKTSRPEVSYDIIVVQSNFFIRFLEELRIPKSPFEIN